MSQRFDPYHAWLGIPPDEQPPNFYRLLGVPLFESNEDVIQNGLDQRMAHVKSFASGPHAAQSQRLLTELSRAGVCLLRAEKRQHYDEQLRAGLTPIRATATSREPVPPGAPPPRAIAAPSAWTQSPLQSVPFNEQTRPPAPVEASVSIRSARATKSGFPFGPAVAGSVVGLAIAGAALLLFLSGGTTEDTIAQTPPGQPDAILEQTEPSVEPSPPENEKVAAAEDATPGPVSQASPVTLEGQPGGNDPATGPIGSAARTMEPGDPPSPSPFESTSLPPPSWPAPLPGSPAVNQTPLPSTGSVSMTPLGTSPDGAAAGQTSALAGETKSIVLDLERSTMYLTLAENVQGKEVRAQVKSITNLGTPYHLLPDHGIVEQAAPVDVILSQYAGVKIRLSMGLKGDSAELEVTPEIEAEQGKTSDFSKRKLENAQRALVRSFNNLNSQLGAAQRDAQMLQQAMSQPAAAVVRTEQRRRHRILTNQTIPTLQAQMNYVQARGEVLRQLGVLAESIHEKAKIDLVVDVRSAGEAE